MTEEIFEIEGIQFILQKYSNEDIQELNEARNKGRHLIGTYSYEIHTPHNPTGEKHIHLINHGNEILSMNKSGSAHDGL